MKKVLKVILIVLLAIVLIIVGYVVYVFASYSRIEDNLALTPENSGSFDDSLATGTEYSIMTYNIGFGAYLQDYSFFMDGGESSWARSEELLVENIGNIGTFVDSFEPDFVYLQEVDINGTRTYHVNEFEMLKERIGAGSFVFSMNYHSAFLFWPVNEPHGANQSGIMTYSRDVAIESALRRSLPISTSLKKIVDLDRCYSVSRIPVENGRYLCLYNLHLSAYGTDASVQEGQRNMLFEDMSRDVQAGNYVICGGDFNHNLRQGAVSDNIPAWATPFPYDQLPDGMRAGYVNAASTDMDTDTCRNSNEPYQPGHTFTVMADGFLVSDNVSVDLYRTVDAEFLYSDHNPVYMTFELQE
ncbi:MAG: endonuclease/exonuclease/phosphatase family protein [Clostridiales bacterium]|nr:endonuclease/exonuclease/phosphatase family protein [Clostridiales bacterium]